MAKVRTAALAGAAALMLTLTPACKRQSTEQPAPVIIATVDGEPIYAYQIARELERFHVGEDAGPARVKLVRSILDGLVLERILLTEADRQKIEVSKEEATEALAQLARGYRARDFHEMIHHNYLTPGLLQNRVMDRLRIERLLELQVREIPQPTDEELAAYYQQNPERFSVPEQVRVRQIVVRTREEAEQLRERARHNTLFEELARKHSVAPEASRGGDLGYFGRGVMPPIFDQICFSMSPGDISDVVASEYGFHLFQMVEKRSAGNMSLEEARGDIVQELTEAKRQQAVNAYIEGLRARAKVVRDVDAAARLVEKEEA